MKLTSRLRLGTIALIAGASLLAASFLPPRAQAQTPSNPAPYNVDLGAVITNALRGAGTVTTSLEANTNWRGVVCTLDPTASSGSGSITFKIQSYDAANAVYTDLIQTTGLTVGPTVSSTVLNTPYSLIVYPGMQTTGLPTNVKAISMSLPRSWRVSQTISSGGGNTNNAITGKIGCNYLL